MPDPSRSSPLWREFRRAEARFEAAPWSCRLEAVAICAYTRWAKRYCGPHAERMISTRIRLCARIAQRAAEKRNV